MGKQYDALTDKDIQFIDAQKLFYIASSSDAEVNLSPKGYESIVIKDNKNLYFLDYPGSGNRTYRDAINQGKFTLLFNAFEGPATILRLFCEAKVLNKEHSDFTEALSKFNETQRVVRNIILFTIVKVESSCGMAVPFMEFKAERTELKEWAHSMQGKGKLDQYIQDHYVPKKILKES